jgi:benzylsuccinate CoA-transferase BbsF subunit
MLAPINSPREIWASEQLAARDFFTRRCFAVIHEGTTAVLQRPVPDRTRAWEGTTIVELGSGAAGPIAVRYFAEHGATVIRLESRTRPDFLRVYALGPDNPHGLEGAPMFDGLNCGKLGVTLNLKHPDGVAVARRLIAGADAVAENFAPRAMRAFGLDYETLARDQPDLVMLSACLNGQTGPHRDYPGFGGQGAALAGFNFLTGWPDREPIGPHGTITDSLAPRFSAVALAAALLHRRRTGRGAYIDLAQVEAGLWTLWPWLRAYRDDGAVGARLGNRHPDAIVHGVFPCAGDDRWIAIAAWTPAEWNDLVRVTDLRADASQSEAEKLLGEWTATRQRDDIAEQLQAAGVEAVPVADFGDLHDDPQLAARHHFQPLTHPYLGAGLYERNGFRIDGVPSGYDGPGPTLGEHTDQVLRANGGYDPAEIEALRARGALQ